MSFLCSKCSEPMVPVVAIDIDGVLGQYHEHLLNFFENYFGREMPRGWTGRGNWEDYLGLPHSEYSAAKLAFRQGGLKRWMPLFDGAASLTQELSDAGAEVWITTTRPYLRLDSVDPDTRWWLEHNNIYYDHLIYDDEKYSRLAKMVQPFRVCAVLDDLPEQYAKAGAQFSWDIPVMMVADHNRAWRESAEGPYREVKDLITAEAYLKVVIKGWQERWCV